MPDLPYFSPTPDVSSLGSQHPAEIRDMVLRACPPGTPARPRPDRPHTRQADDTSEPPADPA